jgi:hypothetical protein
MKKTIILLMMCSVSALFCLAQKTGYVKGNKLLNVGIGINSYYDKGIPVGASFEYGITNEISVGANVDYVSSKYNYGYGYDYKFTTIYFGVRGSYHFNELLNIENEKIDLYAGATLGFRSFGWKDSYSNSGLSGSYGSGVYAGAFAAGKYYFSKIVGAFVEVGAIGSTNARVGLGFKF